MISDKYFEVFLYFDNDDVLKNHFHIYELKDSDIPVHDNEVYKWKHQNKDFNKIYLVDGLSSGPAHYKAIIVAKNMIVAQETFWKLYDEYLNLDEEEIKCQTMRDRDYVIDATNSINEFINEVTSAIIDIHIEIDEMKKKYDNILDNKGTNLIKEREVDKALPKIGDEYWFIQSNGNIEREKWDNNKIDIARKVVGNVFETKEEVEFEIIRRKVISILKKYAEKSPVWNEGKAHYYLCLDAIRNVYYIDITYEYNIGVLTFARREDAQDAVAEAGIDNVIKYYFGVNQRD